MIGRYCWQLYVLLFLAGFNWLICIVGLNWNTSYRHNRHVSLRILHWGMVLTYPDVNLGFGEHLWEIQATNEVTLLKVGRVWSLTVP